MKTAARPLKKKLISNIAMILLSAFLLVSFLVYYGLNSLSNKFLDLSSKRSTQVKKDLEVFSEKNTVRIKQRFLEALKTKGTKLVKKDSLSLLTSFNDNSFSSVRDFLRNSFKDDNDIVHASFFVLEDGEVKAWQYLTKKFPEGTNLPLVYNSKKQSWVGTYGSNNKKVTIKDPRITEIVTSLQFDTGIQIIKNLNGEDIEVFDVAIPIYSGLGNAGYKNILNEALENDEAIGFLRYTLSLDQMHKAIKEEKENLLKYFNILEEQNLKAAIETKVTGENLLRKILFFLGIATLLILFINYFVISFFSEKITKPLQSLISVAEKIALGRYKQNINVSTDDEIGILADTFQDMSNAIVKRDEELEELNKGLEELVQQRTMQLDLEMNKVKNLLDSMRQSVFSIDSKGRIVAPVSKYTENIFEQKLNGESIYQTVFSDLPEKSSTMVALKTAMATVFDEDDLQWMLMEDNLPSKVIINQGTIKEKSLKISYNPLWNNDGFLEQIMFVIDDITELERLEIQRAENAHRIEILHELSASSKEDLQSFFHNSYQLIELINESFKSKTSVLDDKEVLLRNLHTLKGNSRVFGLMKLAADIHDVESSLEDFYDELDQELSNNLYCKTSKDLNDSIDLFQKYIKYSEEVLHLQNSFRIERVEDAHRVLLKSVNLKDDELRVISSNLSPIADSDLTQAYNEYLVNDSENNYENLSWSISNFVLKSVAESSLYQPYLRSNNSIKAALELVSNKDYQPRTISKYLNIFSIQDTDNTDLVESVLKLLVYIDFNFRYNSSSEMNVAISLDWEAILAGYPLAKGLDKDSSSSALKFLKNLLTDRENTFSYDTAMKTDIVMLKDLLHNKKFKECYDEITKFDFKSSSFSERLKLFCLASEGGKYAAMLSLRQIVDSYIQDATTINYEYRKTNVYEKSYQELESYIINNNNSEVLRKLLTNLKTVPLKSSFSRFFNMVDDISQKQDKKIIFEVVGDDVFIDKVRIEKINDALTHLIRNSIDHGIESVATRKELGKAPFGKISLDVKQTDNLIYLNFSDDGQGLDIESIKRKAIQNNLIKPHDLDGLENEEITNLIFIPELSTKDIANDISGRGIGMSAVKDTIEKIGGKISIDNRPGNGLTISFVIMINSQTHNEEKTAA